MGEARVGSPTRISAAARVDLNPTLPRTERTTCVSATTQHTGTIPQPGQNNTRRPRSAEVYKWKPRDQNGSTLRASTKRGTVGINWQSWSVLKKVRASGRTPCSVHDRIQTRTRAMVNLPPPPAIIECVVEQVAYSQTRHALSAQRGRPRVPRHRATQVARTSVENSCRTRAKIRGGPDLRKQMSGSRGIKKALRHLRRAAAERGTVAVNEQGGSVLTKYEPAAARRVVD
jgi:hypothetical protein